FIVMSKNNQNINLKSIFRTCQRNSEKFKYREILTQEDLVLNSFWYNAEIIPEVNTFKTTYYEALALKKGIALDKFHEVYWNRLRKKFNKSPSNIETFKKFLISTLEKQLFPKYFEQNKLLFQHYFRSDYSLSLFKKSPTNIFKLLTA